MEFSTLWLFIITAIFLIVVPGPSVFYIIARSIDQGKNAGLTSVIGVACGTTIHIIGAGIGISALLMTSAFAFNIVKYLGAAYLIYLGLKTLFFSKDSTSSIPKIKQINLRKVFYQSVIVETLNPKVALFFLALFPQFIVPSAGSIPLQILTLGSIFIIIGIISDGLYALLAASISNWITGSPLRTRIQNRLTGGVYISLGIVAALANPSEATK